jgi:catechol 2,3-dioxygenase-like lactoylglutathione lyase family enzyme
MSARFDAMGIVVSDVPTSVAFYELLGLEFPREQGEGHVEALLARRLRLMLDSESVVESFDPTWERPIGRGRIGLAFLCDDPADVDATHARIVAVGHRSHLEPFDAPWGQRYASVLDPDGNVIDLFAPLRR